MNMNTEFEEKTLTHATVTVNDVMIGLTWAPWNCIKMAVHQKTVCGRSMPGTHSNNHILNISIYICHAIQEMEWKCPTCFLNIHLHFMNGFCLLHNAANYFLKEFYS